MEKNTTGKYSLLVPDGEYSFRALSPVVMHDLGLDMICRQLSANESEQNYIMGVMSRIYADPSVTKYRGGVFDDIIGNKKLRDDMMEILGKISFLKDYGSFKRDYDENSGIWDLMHRLDEIGDYIECVDSLYSCLKDKNLHSEGFTGLVLFMYIYVCVLRPFDELEDYASHLAAGDMDTELKYRRVNMFGSFTWAFDHMRTEIMHARRREQEAIENNKTVIATLSHDIKTPIASIRGYAEALVMNMDATPERRERYASVIMKKCDEVTSITNDMFIHSLHDLDRLAVKSDEVEIKPLLEQVLSDIGLGMNIVVNGDITEAVLEHSDSGRVVQVIENILSNASKYARDTEISIVTECIEPEKLPRNVHVGGADMVYSLSIKDHGTGIPDKDMPFIYEKFYRGENSGDEPGAGLGLFIVHYLMDRMGGDVELVNHAEGLEAVLYFAARKVC